MAITTGAKGYKFRACARVANLSLAAFNARLYLAWQQPSNIYFASMGQNSDWSGATEIPGMPTTGSSPSLAVFNGKLYMAWTGVMQYGRIHFSSMDSNGGWSAPTSFLIPGQTQRSPALARFNNCLYNVCSGNPNAPDFDGICYSYYPCAENRGF